MYLEHWYELIEKWTESPENNRTRVLEEILYGKGIPAEVRPELWVTATGGLRKKRQFPGRYKDCCDSKHKVDSTINAISRDIKRTFPAFQIHALTGLGNKSEFEPHEKALFNVLSAISIAMPDIGYHQGLNFVAAMLLVVLKGVKSPKLRNLRLEVSKENDDWFETEESTFWVMLSLLNGEDMLNQFKPDCLVQEYHLAGLYHANSSFLQQFVDQFDTLFRRFLPRMHAHLLTKLDHRMEPVLFAVDWFTTMFTYSLQFDAVLILWDCFLVARLDEALYLTGLALLLHLADESIPYCLVNTVFVMICTKYIQQSTTSFGDATTSFRELKRMPAAEFRKMLRQVVNRYGGRVKLWLKIPRLIPSSLMPPGHSTLFRIERELQDPTNPYTTQQFGASRLVEYVQLGKGEDVKQEVQKYVFPSYILENMLLRATMLGYPEVVDALIAIGGCNPDCRATFKTYGITPLHICSILGHPTVARVLLARGAKIDAKCTFKKILETLNLDESVTPGSIAQTMLKRSGKPFSCVVEVLKGNVCIGCGLYLRNDETARSLLNSIFSTQPSEAVKRGAKSGVLSFCSKCYEFEKIKDNRERLLWQTARKIKLERPMGPMSWHCHHCKVGLIGKRKVTCKRCFFSFCITCAFTFRVLKSRSPSKLVRVCQNCHHVLRSCPCSLHKSLTAGIEQKKVNHKQSSVSIYCAHMPFDYSKQSIDLSELSNDSDTSCECMSCRNQIYRVWEPVVSAKVAPYKSQCGAIKRKEFAMFSPVQATLHGYSVGDYEIESLIKADNQELSNVWIIMNEVQKCLHYTVAKNTKTKKGLDSRNICKQVNTSMENGIAQAQNGVNQIDYEKELEEFYRKWNPAKLASVKTMLQKFRGNEDKLLESLKLSYGITS